MNYFASKHSHGITQYVSKGDTITVRLPYHDQEGHRTAWSLVDYSYNPILSMGTVEAKDGILTKEFVAMQPGTADISLVESTVLGLSGPSSVISKIRIPVQVR